jgi:hypothetical protein
MNLQTSLSERSESGVKGQREFEASDVDKDIAKTRSE